MSSVIARGLVRKLRHVAFSSRVRFSARGRGKNARIEPIDVLLVTVPKHTLDYPPSGIAYLKSYLQSQGYLCRCIDFNVRLIDNLRARSDWRKRIRTEFSDVASFDTFCQQGYSGIMDGWVSEVLSLKPRFIAFSATSYTTVKTIQYLSKRLKPEIPNTPIIVGGPACAIYKEKMISEYGSDIAILGRGETTLKKVLDAIGSNAGMEHIKGIVYRKNDIIVSTQGEEDQDILDNLPFPNYDDFDLSQYASKNPLSNRSMLVVQGSRGCTRSCTFCSYKLYTNSFQKRAAKKVFDEMAYLKKRYGVHTFGFSDAMINADVPFLESLCDLILESNELFLWHGQFGFKQDTTPFLIHKMAKAGCCSLVIGLESGSEKVRKEMLKACPDSHIQVLLEALHDAKIHCNVNVMVGYPTETPEDFQATLSYLERFHSLMGSIRIQACYILKDTILWKKARKDHDFVLSDEDPTSWSYKDNTPKERLGRMEQAIVAASRYGLAYECVQCQR